MFGKQKNTSEESSSPAKQDGAAGQETEEKKGAFQMSEKSRLSLYGLIGIYLIYLAYQIFQDAQEEGELSPAVILAAVFFAAVGVLLVIRLLRFYLVKPKEGSKEEEYLRQETGYASSDDRMSGAADAAKRASDASGPSAGRSAASRPGAGTGAGPSSADLSSADLSAVGPSTVGSSAMGTSADDVFSRRAPRLTCKAVILAAGKGTRMHSDLPKVLHEIDEKPMALYVKEAVCEAGAQVVCYVIGYQKDRVRIALADRGVTFAVQEEQLGTGHAVRCAKNFIGDQGDVFVLCGDTPLITGETLSRLLERHRERGNAVTALSAMLDDPYGYGRIIRDEDGAFVRSVEEKDATPEERLIKEGNVGMYVFRAADLSEAVDYLSNDNVQGEYYLPDTLMILKAMGRRVDAYCIENTPEILGVNTPEQLEEAAREIARRQEAQEV